jgi:hypothetical protein
MEKSFSQFQNKALQNIWQLGLFVAFLSSSSYFIYTYGPDNKTYNMINDIQVWLMNSLIFSWYFYKNKFYYKGIIIQIFFIPYYFFSESFGTSIDYFLSFSNIEIIYKIAPFFLYILPLIAFTKLYFQNERNNSKKIIPLFLYFILTLFLNYLLDSNPDDLFNFVSTFSSDSPLKQDIIVCCIFSLFALKSICLLIGFFYISNRIESLKKLIYPIENQNCNSKMFLNGFVVSYTILFFVTIDLVKKIALFVFLEINAIQIISFLSIFFALFVSARFNGQLIQNRNYSLKKYFGIINLFLIVPIVNIISLLVLYFAKINVDFEKYRSSLNKKRIIHIIIYTIIITGYIAYNYFELEKEFRNIQVFYYIPLYVLALYLVSQFKWSTKIVPFAVVIILYYEDLMAYFELTEGFKIFFNKKIISFAWISGFSICLLYYIGYYIMHKSFYSSYFANKNESILKDELAQFEK